MEKISYSPSFQANLRIKGLNFKDKKKLEAVKDIFAKKTQHYASDTFTLKGVKYQNDKGQFYHSIDFVCNGNGTCFALTGTFKKFFENNSAEDVAKSLVRVFKKGKADDVFSKKFNIINKNLQRTYAGSLLNEEKASLASLRGHEALANRYRFLSESNEKRSNTLLAQRESLKEYFDTIIEKIKDNPISNVVYWD